MGYGGMIDRAASKRRRKERPTPTVRTLVVCPTCDFAYRVNATGTGLDALDRRALQIVRAQALAELAHAIRAKADEDHVAEVLKVVDRCDERLGG